jgi:ribosomal protein S4
VRVWVRVRLLERSNFQVRGHKERTRSRLGARGSDAQERTIFVANDDEEKKILERLPSMKTSKEPPHETVSLFFGQC